MPPRPTAAAVTLPGETMLIAAAASAGPGHGPGIKSPAGPATCILREDDVDASALPAGLIAKLDRYLADDGYVYRFRHDARPLHKAEGAFVLFGFWIAQVADACDDATAARWFERNRAACGRAGLYTEEHDVHQRQLRGNLPQAFVHAGLLESAARMSAAPSAPHLLRSTLA